MKKLLTGVVLILCGVVIFGSIVENVRSTTEQTSETDAKEVKDDHPVGIIDTLNADLDFSTVSPYKYANGNGKVVASITENLLHNDPPELKVTLV